MNYPEELRERYNEVMYDERDIIEKFLKDQYDIRYGRQRDTWHFEDEIEVVSSQGSLVKITDIMLDKDCFVKFHVKAFGHDYSWWECFNFAYGELSKVIEALPDADEIVKRNAIVDIKEALKNRGNISWFTGKKHIIGEDFDVLLVSHKENETNVMLRKFEHNSTRLLESLSSKELAQLRDYINIDFLHGSNEYKELMELLSLEENMRFECQNYGDATFVIDGTDVTFDISSVRRDDKGNLVIYGNDIDADVCDNIELTEKDIKHEYLVGIINEMKRSKYHDIMDTYNSHNPELVRKINAAWKSGKYNQEFGYIIYSIANRDYNECKEKFDCDMDNFLSSIIDDCNESSIHNVLENVCDDWDLETILSFIRYEE